MQDLSTEYYTRYHIWQGLVRALGKDIPSPETMSALSLAGWEFIWRDGTDVFIPEEEDKSQAKLPLDVPDMGYL